MLALRRSLWGPGNYFADFFETYKTDKSMKKTFYRQSYLLKIMRISLIQLFIIIEFSGLTFAFDGFGQEVLNRRLTINIREQKIGAALEQIGKISGVHFMYSPELIRSQRKVTFSAKEEKLEAILDNFLTPLQVSYEVSGKQILLKRATPKPAINLPEGAGTSIKTIQSIDSQIKGKVKDATGGTIPGATVVLKRQLVGGYHNRCRRRVRIECSRRQHYARRIVDRLSYPGNRYYQQIDGGSDASIRY